VRAAMLSAFDAALKTIRALPYVRRSAKSRDFDQYYVPMKMSGIGLGRPRDLARSRRPQNIEKWWKMTLYYTNWYASWIAPTGQPGLA
jgi:hypothetical protein